MKPYINILGHDIYTYGIFIALGLIVAGIVFLMLGTKYAKFIDIIEFLFYVCLNSIITAKVVFLISAVPDIIANPAYLNACLLEGGFNFMGGLMGSLFTAIYMCKRRDMSLPRVLSAFVIAICIGHSILKVGCIFNGCCYGLAHTGIFSIAIEGVGSTFAIQMIESILSLALFVFLFVLFQKVEYKDESKIHIYFMLLYPIIKFVIEFFRGDAIRGVYILSISQWLCILLFLMGLIFLAKNSMSKPKEQPSVVTYSKLRHKKNTAYPGNLNPVVKSTSVDSVKAVEPTVAPVIEPLEESDDAIEEYSFDDTSLNTESLEDIDTFDNVDRASMGVAEVQDIEFAPIDDEPEDTVSDSNTDFVFPEFDSLDVLRSNDSNLDTAKAKKPRKSKSIAEPKSTVKKDKTAKKAPKVEKSVDVEQVSIKETKPAKAPKVDKTPKTPKTTKTKEKKATSSKKSVTTAITSSESKATTAIDALARLKALEELKHSVTEPTVNNTTKATKSTKTKKSITNEAKADSVDTTKKTKSATKSKTSKRKSNETDKIIDKMTGSNILDEATRLEIDKLLADFGVNDEDSK